LQDGSPVGRVLHALAGYTARPTPIQLVFYLATLITIGAFMKISTNRRTDHRAAVLLFFAGLAGACAFGIPGPADASKFKVYSPIVEQGELEIEARARITDDGSASKDDERRIKVGVGYGVTEWWFTEIEGF
jgi:hypothetical protein